MADKPQKILDSFAFTDRFIRNLFITFAGILMVYVIFWVGTEIRNNLREHRYIGQADRPVHVVSIQGTGEVYGVPTLAKVQLGLVTEAPTVIQAQAANTTSMNELQAGLRATGIPEKDIQTQNYNLYPVYVYREGEQKLTGYSVNHVVEVRLRELDRIDDVLQLASSRGANQISGIEFTIEDKDDLVAEARTEALEKVQRKIRDLASALGVRVVRVAGFNEYVPEDGGHLPLYARGGFLAEESVPEVSSGSEKIQVIVTVDFEVE